MIKLQLHGTIEELDEFTEYLKTLSSELKILSQSELYADRGKSVYSRIYLDVELKNESATDILKRLQGGKQ